MTPERWAQIEDLFHAAQVLPLDARTRFLAERCGDDIDLSREVESLLNEPASQDGFLAQPALVRGAQMLSAPPRSTLAGRRVGRYQLQSLIGAGGMGEVYHSHDATLGRDVAVKVLPPGFTNDPDRLARLEREARMLASLNHPNICGIYGIEEAEGVRLLLLEFVDGETLADKLQRESGAAAGSRGLSLAEALSIARQLADALEAAHEKGIVHRDLKPANIKITPDGVVKVLDFGLAKSIAAGSSPELTQVPSTPAGDGADGAVIGTAAYMSPEQARGARVDSRTDIWSFGCVLYEMLTGRLAFAGATTSDTLAKILEREPDWTALPAHIPAGIRRVLVRCLTKDARRRVRDIGDVRIEIDVIDEVLPGLPALPPESGAKPPRASWLPWFAFVALAAASAMMQLRGPVAPTNPIADAKFSYLTDWKGTEAAAAISPDGKFAAFLSDRAGEFDVWVTQIGTGDFNNLTVDLPPLDGQGILRTLGFTADGEVWFTVPGANASAGRKLIRPITGGASRPLLGPSSAGPSWSSDGSRLAYFNNDLGDPMFLADGSAADAAPLVAIDPQWPHAHNPIWSADDRWVYFTRGFVYGLNETDEMDIWRVRPTGGAPERMTSANTDIGLMTALGTRTILFVGRSDDRTGPWLWALDTETRSRLRISSGLERYTSVAASHDGRRIVASLANPTSSLWTVPLDRVSDEGDVRPYEVPTGGPLAPRFGGDALFYLSTTLAGEGLVRLSGGTASVIWKGSEGTPSEAPAVSRDGRHVAVIMRREGKQQLSVMSADGTDRRAVATSIAIQGTADWSPDGAWIVTGGTDSRGPGLFKVPLTGGEAIRLVSTKSTNPVWSPDGQVIVYGTQLVAGQVTLMAVTPDGTPVALAKVLAHPGAYRFMPGGKALVYLPRPRTLDFWMLDLASGTTRQITHLNDGGRLRTFDITPDGKQLVFDRSHQNSDVVLIERKN